MALNLEPPSFISDTKSYAEYKQDLQRWSRLTSYDKKLQAELVVQCLDGDPSKIKEKIVSQIGDTLIGNAAGIEALITFLDSIYGKDDMSDIWEKYKAFSTHCRKPDQDIVDFLSNWEMSYHKLKTGGCTYSDLILGLKLLEDARLSDIETKLVLTGVNYVDAKTNKDFQKQITNSLRKFTGRSVISTSRKDDLSVSVKPEPTWLSEVEEVLLAKGWKPPIKGSRRRSRSESPPRNRSSNYKGKKNTLGPDQKPRKCYICKCDHVENCTCPCVYHLADKCPSRKKSVSFGDVTKKIIPNNKQKLDLGLFVNSIAPTLFAEDDEDVILLTSQKLMNLVLLTASCFEAVVDCACPTTVAGEKWINEFISHIDTENRSHIRLIESKRIFKFGGGEKRQSKGVIIFPCRFADKNVKMRTEVVDADFPLLLGNTTLKRAGAVLYLREEKALILGSEVVMKESESGHFLLKIGVPLIGEEFHKIENMETNDDSKQAEEYIIDCLVALSSELTYKDIVKLHQVFGHVSIKKLEKLIDNSKRLTKEVKGYLKDVEAKCRSCKLNQNVKPRPTVSLPRASAFNQIVTVDLKHYTDGKDKYIMYLVDMYSRLIAGSLIPTKEPSKVGEKIMEKWVSNFGRMDTIHSDRGGEFCCEELVAIAEYLGVRSSFTAAYSPYQNGINERNHAICDRMISKMRTHDPSLSVQVALTWALVAKNSLENVSGFSPFQIVFGSQPKLPSVYTSGPPGYEEVEMNKAVADHINALFLGREAYVQCESDKILKAALKQKIYKRGENVETGDWIYFNNRGKWEGPVKVTTKDGKKLYAVRGGKLLTINTDHAQLAMFEGEFNKSCEKADVAIGPQIVDQDVVRVNNQIEDARKSNPNGCPLNVSNSASNELDSDKENSLTENISENPVTSTDDISTESIASVEPTQSSTPHDVNNGVKLKKNDVIRFQVTAGSEEVNGKVTGLGGKRNGIYDKWYNVKNLETGHEKSYDFGKIHSVQKVNESAPKSGEGDNVYVVQIPRYRHQENSCKEAKERELMSWDQYQVYEEVKDEGQIRIGTNWVLTEKIKYDLREIKARLTIRGDQEETTGVRKDSPTVRKGNIKIFVTIAAREGWQIMTSDVASAFLQGLEIDRDVFVLPPVERRIPGVLWKLLKPVYGLVDAPRGWYLALDEEFTKNGCEKCSLDPAMYLSFTTEDEKRLDGLALTHVDDILHGGTKHFDENVMAGVKSSFKFGLEEKDTFKYVGMNIKRTQNSILIDQDHYVKGLELPDMEFARNLKVTDVLCVEGQTVFRGCVARILHIGYQSRPDVCFEGKCLSTKFGKATKGDLKTALKKIQKLQGQPTKMCFPDIGEISEWTFVGYADAGIKSMPDKISSVGGQVILIANSHKQVACILNWRSKKLVRKVVSSLAGEALALVAAIGEMVYNKSIMKQIYGNIIDDVPVIMFTDSRNLYESIHSTSLVQDAWLIPDIAVIKEALGNSTISCLRRVASEDMLANCLTKAGASAVQLLDVLQTGIYELPCGLDKEQWV